MAKKKRPVISIIGTAGVPSNYGGFETLADNLVTRLSNSFEFIVYCSRDRKSPSSNTTGNNKCRHDGYHGARLVHLPMKANGIQSILYDICSMFHACFVSDILLVLGVSGCIMLPIFRFFSRKKIIVNVDGMEWKRQKWGPFARIFLKFSWKTAVKHADTIIADNKHIQTYIKDSCKRQSHLIEYGGDHGTGQSGESAGNYSFLKEKYALTICRIEPENNVEMVLKAFTQMQEANIVMIGNWDNSAFSITMKEKYGHFSNIFLVPAIYDISVLNSIRGKAMAYIHGHSAGGTNPSLVEIMFHGIPVIAYDISYNRETTENKAFYFNDGKDIVGHVKKILDSDLSEDMREMGDIMLEIANRRYKWEVIADKYRKILE